MLKVTLASTIRLKQYYYEYTVVFLSLLILLLLNALPFEIFNTLSYFYKAGILFVVLMFVFKLRSTSAFFLAFISLSAATILLLIKNNALAEMLSITAYYFLTIGVVREIASFRKETKTS